MKKIHYIPYDGHAFVILFVKQELRVFNQEKQPSEFQCCVPTCTHGGLKMTPKNGFKFRVNFVPHFMSWSFSPIYSLVLVTKLYAHSYRGAQAGGGGYRLGQSPGSKSEGPILKIK